MTSTTLNGTQRRAAKALALQAANELPIVEVSTRDEILIYMKSFRSDEMIPHRYAMGKDGDKAFAYALPTVIAARSSHEVKPTTRTLVFGQRIEIDGVVYTMTEANNDNLQLVA